MRNRHWTGTLRHSGQVIDIYHYVDDDELIVQRFLEEEGNWEDASKIEDRTPPGSEDPAPLRIWVAHFRHDAEILVDWWTELNEVRIAHRPFSYYSWGAPVTCTEVQPEGAA